MARLKQIVQQLPPAVRRSEAGKEDFLRSETLRLAALYPGYCIPRMNNDTLFSAAFADETAELFCTVAQIHAGNEDMFLTTNVRSMNGIIELYYIKLLERMPAEKRGAFLDRLLSQDSFHAIHEILKTRR